MGAAEATAVDRCYLPYKQTCTARSTADHVSGLPTSLVCMLLELPCRRGLIPRCALAKRWLGNLHKKECVRARRAAVVPSPWHICVRQRQTDAQQSAGCTFCQLNRSESPHAIVQQTRFHSIGLLEGLAQLLIRALRLLENRSTNHGTSRVWVLVPFAFVRRSASTCRLPGHRTVRGSKPTSYQARGNPMPAEQGPQGKP